ncbi:hypothetical protein HYY74_04085 [Candidatus Woesearchaeota archaeon]|nr:hypothetical protein [Candidatus Woesearchaeota archaeon]
MKVAYLIAGVLLIALLAGCTAQPTSPSSGGSSLQQDTQTLSESDQSFMGESEEMEIGEMAP